MFPPDQSGNHTWFHQEDSIQHDLIWSQATLEASNQTIKMGKGQRHRILPTAKENYGNSNNNCQDKKITRKEIERQRRQHMTMLHASLRSLLHLKSIKGRRSVSDHVNEAVNYISHLKENIQNLILKREKLKNLSHLGVLYYQNSSSNNCLTNCVTAHFYLGGVEIVINSVLGKKNFPLSPVLKSVLEEGLDVVRCVSTQTNDRCYHTIIQTQGNLACVDLRGLQQKLNHIIISML